jgi:hypothetical protein
MSGQAYSTTAGYGGPQILPDGSIREVPVAQLLGLVYNELRILNELIRIGLNIPDETDSFRGDAGYQAPTTLTNPA